MLTNRSLGIRKSRLRPMMPARDGAFTGVDILRAIALARLLLPANVKIMAPLATLGPKLAQVALEFGASHLGCVAADGEMPGDPLTADAPSSRNWREAAHLRS